MNDALLAGGTGLVGREVAALWAGPGSLHLLLRRARPATLARTRWQQDHRVDFAAPQGLAALPAATQAYCCLGTTLKVAGSQAAFRAVDLDAVLAFARAARSAGVTRFAVVSALGASTKSASFYSRTKGEMEAALATLGFDCLVITRPSLLAGSRQALGQAARPAEQWALALTRPLSGLIPAAWRPIEAATVARAMRRALDAGEPGVHVIESASLQRLGQPGAP